MSAFIETFRQHLVVFLLVNGVLLAAVLLFLVVNRAADEWRFRRSQRRQAALQPLVERMVGPAPDPLAAAELAAAALRHPAEVSTLLLKVARLTEGSLVDRLRRVALDGGLVTRWLRGLEDRRWWVRAEAALALGLVGEAAAVPGVLSLLDDAHDEVRAAAVDALGRLGPPEAIPALIARLSSESRHQRARVVEALRRFGEAVARPLLSHAAAHPEDRPMAAELLGLIGGTAALDALLEWTSADDPALRAAALEALAAVGIDDRAFYFALRGLGDADPDVRAMAARALGRSARAEAAPYLAAHLDDEWIVAAHAATALRRLGDAGARALAARAGESTMAGRLARQMLWEAPAPAPEAVCA
jgi:HEAT repeat protein